TATGCATCWPSTAKSTNTTCTRAPATASTTRVPSRSRRTRRRPPGWPPTPSSSATSPGIRGEAGRPAPAGARSVGPPDRIRVVFGPGLRAQRREDLLEGGQLLGLPLDELLEQRHHPG